MSTPPPDATPPAPRSPEPTAETAAPAGDAPAGAPATGAPAEDGPAGEAPAGAAPEARAIDVADTSRMRRAPRYGRFAVVGFLLGAVLAAVLTQLPQDQTPLAQYAPRDVFLILLIALGVVGTLAGLTWALISDRRSLRRRR